MVSLLLHHLSHQRLCVAHSLTVILSQGAAKLILMWAISTSRSLVPTPREDPTARAAQVPLPLMFLTSCPLQRLPRNVAKCAGMSVYQTLAGASRPWSYVNFSQLIAAKVSVSLSPLITRRYEGFVLFLFLFLPHLSVLSPLAAGARHVFGRVEHCFPSHCQGGCLSLKYFNITYVGGGHTYMHTHTQTYLLRVLVRTLEDSLLLL